MSAIIFRPDSGNQYREFQRESVHAAKHWGAEVHAFPAGKSAHVRRQFVIDVLARPRLHKLDRVAFLCHGYRTGIQAGFDLSTALELAEALRWDAPSCVVSLYCCSTGKSNANANGEGSFADMLRDALVHKGFRGTWMLTHTTAGHLSRNPDVRMYQLEPNIIGGVDVCRRSVDRGLYSRFRGLLHTPSGRWDIAGLDPPTIEARAALCEPWTG